MDVPGNLNKWSFMTDNATHVIEAGRTSPDWVYEAIAARSAELLSSAYNDHFSIRRSKPKTINRKKLLI